VAPPVVLGSARFALRAGERRTLTVSLPRGLTGSPAAGRSPRRGA
jgi:hypothetical protein